MGKPKVARVPIRGNLAHNAAFIHAIGQLVVDWANNESVFLAMLQTLVGGSKHTAAIIWEAQRTSRNRLELITKLARDRIVKDEDLVKDISNAARAFRGFSRTRNLFCHATYAYDKKSRQLLTATSVTTDTEDGRLDVIVRTMNLQTLNEITSASTRLTEFNATAWKLVRRLESALGVQHVNYPPELLDDPQSPESHHPKDEVLAREEQPSPSEASLEEPSEREIALTPVVFRAIRLLSKDTVGIQCTDQTGHVRTLEVPLRNAMFLMAMLHAMHEQSGFELPDDLHSLTPA